MAVAEPHQHRRAGRRRLVAAPQVLAGLDHRKGLAGVDAKRLEHFGRENLAHRALQRQPPVAVRGSTASGPSPWCRDRAGAPGRSWRHRAAGRTESRARRRSRDCRPGTGARDSAAPAAGAGCRAAARIARSGRPIARPEASARPTARSQRRLRKRRTWRGKSAAATGSPSHSARLAIWGSGK